MKGLCIIKCGDLCVQVSAAPPSFGTQTWMFVSRVHRASSTRRPRPATHVRHRQRRFVSSSSPSVLQLTLSCSVLLGKPVEDTPDVWKLAAITSFSVLAVVLVGAALIIGVMVHRRKSHKRPLRGEILFFLCHVKCVRAKRCNQGSATLKRSFLC